MTKITKLTKEQEARIPEWVRKWVTIGLRTGETDWDTFDKYMPICYEKAGLKYPNKVVRVDSPLVGALAAARVGSRVGSRVAGSVVGSVRSEVFSADSAAGSVVGSVRSEVFSAVSAAESAVASVSSAVASVASEVSSVDWAVDSAVVSVVESKRGLHWHPWLGGQFWAAGWYGSPALVSFLTDVCGLKLPQDIEERATAYRRVCESVNYIWPNKKFVMVCARPSRITLNQEGQLHHETNQAIEYPDGWGLWMLNGVRVPEEIVTTPAEKLDPKRVLDEKNTDVQRELIRKIGPERVLEATNAKTLDEWTDKNTGFTYQLMNMSLDNIKRKYLYFEHATLEGIFYAKPVPPECAKALHARAWILSMIERDNLRTIDETTEQQIEKHLPKHVS